MRQRYNSIARTFFADATISVGKVAHPHTHANRENTNTQAYRSVFLRWQLTSHIRQEILLFSPGTYFRTPIPFYFRAQRARSWQNRNDERMGDRRKTL